MSTTNYHLNTHTESAGGLSTVRKMLAFLKDEKASLVVALCAMLINSAATFVGPYIIGRAIDSYVIPGDFKGVLLSAALLVLVYAVAFVSNYVQMMRMGMVGQRTLFSIRNLVFAKLQELPVAFFSQNKSGDLISRINSDTEKLNQFFSEIVVRFVGIIVTIVGVGAFLIGINAKLGAFALIPAVLMIFFTRVTAGWIKVKNKASLQANGALSGEVQESLDNFKVVVAFGRRDYFRSRFDESNEKAYTTALASGIANAVPAPIYEFGSIAAQIIVLLVGVHMVSTGAFTVGLLVTFFVYVNQFYGPLRQISYLWSGLQTALAAWDRVSVVLGLSSNLQTQEDTSSNNMKTLLSFKDVSFGYSENQQVLRNVSLELEEGKTYALVGPTGGGKTTTASLMARLYDPTSGSVMLGGKDLRSYSENERSGKIGFILQDPFMFSGTIKENIFYGNPHHHDVSDEEAERLLERAGLSGLMKRFDGGLSADVSSSSTLSLGQRQIVAFMRAVLRKPALLILDEATANIDTVTEQVLEEILEKLPKETTRVIIAHRLNTIENADQIFFVNGGTVTAAGDMEHALELLLHGKRTS